MNRISVLACIAVCLALLTGLASAGENGLTAGKINDLADAKTVLANTSYTVSKAGSATLQAQEPAPTCRSATQPSVWFRYIADRTFTVSFDTEGTNFGYAGANANYNEDTVLDIFELSSPDITMLNLSAHLCNDDAPEERYSRIQFTVEAGTWYYIRVTPYLIGHPIHPDGTIKLNVAATNLIENGDFEQWLIDTQWKLSGKARADDDMNCSSPADCDVRMNHSSSVKGASKLTQKIDSLKGVKLGAKTVLTLSAGFEIGGLSPDLTMKLKVVYADGTVDTAKNKLQKTGKLSGVGTFDVSLPLGKPVAKIVVQFRNASNTDGWVSIDDVVLSASKITDIAPAAAAVLPLPPAVK